jgi:hypothetical protein
MKTLKASQWNDSNWYLLTAILLSAANLGVIHSSNLASAENNLQPSPADALILLGQKYGTLISQSTTSPLLIWNLGYRYLIEKTKSYF